jgi:hypothetical protein
MFEKTNGSRAEVWHGTAKKTQGGLTKSDLLMNKHGRIVSRKKHNTAKREKRLVKAGYLTKKGHFGFIKKGKGSKKMKGGNGMTMHKGMMSKSMGHTMKGGNGMAMHKGMMSKSMGHTMKGGNGMMMPKGMTMHKGMMMKKGGKGYSMKTMKGGYALSPSSYNGQGVGTSGAGLQIMSTNMS